MWNLDSCGGAIDFVRPKLQRKVLSELPSWKSFDIIGPELLRVGGRNASPLVYQTGFYYVDCRASVNQTHQVPSLSPRYLQGGPASKEQVPSFWWGDIGR